MESQSKCSILVVGSLNMDLVTRGPTFPSKGQTVMATSFATDCGGKGLNQAVACARASFSQLEAQGPNHVPLVAMIGAVGSDEYGKEMKAELRTNGIDPGMIQTQGTTSGVATIIVDENSGDNWILVAPGANYQLKLDDFKRIVSDPTQRPKVIVLQLEIPLETTLDIIATAKKNKVPILLNPAPAVKLPEESLNGLDHLIMNETEASILGEIGGEIAFDNDAVLKRVFERFHNLGVKQTIVTLGGKGSCYSTGGGGYEKVPAVKVEKVVDTVAAGDTYVGYYAAEIARSATAGTEFEAAKAVARANIAAAKTVQKEGALVSIPWRDEVL